MKRPQFTSFEQKHRWLIDAISEAVNDITRHESAGRWAAADDAYALETKLRRELNELEDDMQLSIPRHQR